MIRRFAIVPAGGTGTRFGSIQPKQFNLLCGKPLWMHAMDTLASCARIDGIFFVFSEQHRNVLPGDLWNERVKPLFCAGTTRAQTVLNALNAIAPVLRPNDYVLVHDAARPCLDSEALERLLSQVGDDAVGGLLAIPVADTLKRSGPDGRSAQTVDRKDLWAAQTPQMIRFQLLRNALLAHPDATDEASAVEAAGHYPMLVMGNPANLKVTHPSDFLMAQWILQGRNPTQENAP